MIRVAFRADGGRSVGMGHLMRCMSLAKEFKKNGHIVYFISKYESGINRLQEEGFEVIPIGNGVESSTEGFDYGNASELQDEAKKVIAAIQTNNIDILFIDSYNVTEEYFLSIKPHVKKLAYIDDLNKFVYPVDILINGNITAEYMDYKKYSEDEIMLLGPKYNLIRDEFMDLPERVINEQVKEIMITTGGSDPYNMSCKIANMLLEDEELCKLTINIIVGSGFTNKGELRELSKNHSNIILHENVKQISDIMLRSDIAISSGGSTLYELCACGTPTLAFIMADNQEFFVRKMDELGCVKSLGWYFNVNNRMFIQCVRDIICDYKIRLILSNKEKEIIDYNCITRILNLIDIG